jgi:hypothetical protein
MVAAFLAFAVGGVHSYLGERYILIRLFRRPDIPHLFGGPEFTTRTLRFAWHITTVAWWGFAALLALLAQRSISVQGVSLVIGITFVATCLITAIISRGRHLAWLCFLAIGVVSLCAAAVI